MKNKSVIKLLLTFSLLTFGAQSIATESHKGGNGVYICLSPKAYRYHKNRSCRGLNKCSYNIILVPVSTAENRGYTPCNICY